jgi:hypothetical protein
VQFTLVNGREDSETVKENKDGQMELYMLENGEKIEHMAEVNLFMLMGIFMMVFGQMIKQMAMEFISM